MVALGYSQSVPVGQAESGAKAAKTHPNPKTSTRYKTSQRKEVFNGKQDLSLCFRGCCTRFYPQGHFSPNSWDRERQTHTVWTQLVLRREVRCCPRSRGREGTRQTTQRCHRKKRGTRPHRRLPFLARIQASTQVRNRRTD